MVNYKKTTPFSPIKLQILFPHRAILWQRVCALCAEGPVVCWAGPGTPGQGAAAGPSCQAEPSQVRAGEQCHNNYQRWAPYATKRKSIHALLAFFIKNFTRFSESVDGFTLLFEKNPTLKSLYCLEESFLNV